MSERSVVNLLFSCFSALMSNGCLLWILECDLMGVIGQAHLIFLFRSASIHSYLHCDYFLYS